MGGRYVGGGLNFHDDDDDDEKLPSLSTWPKSLLITAQRCEQGSSVAAADIKSTLELKAACCWLSTNFKIEFFRGS